MPITNYTSLVAALDGKTGWLHRSDVTARIPEWIALAEADMQGRCKLLEFEAAGTIAVTAGVGALPADFVGMRSVYWDGDTVTPLKFITPDRFDAYRGDSATPRYYSISGASLRVAPTASGNAKTTYSAKFTGISGASETNSLITNHPDVYLYGTLRQFALWKQDAEEVATWTGEMANAVNRITRNNTDRKYAGATLQVRPR